MALSVQDKNYIAENTFTYLQRQYMTMFGRNFWWLDPFPTLSHGNLEKRIQKARQMTGREGDGDPVWSGAIVHMAEQASGTPFSVEGPESAVDASMALLFSGPGGYRPVIKHMVMSWVEADIGSTLEVIWEQPRKLREGVYFKQKPVGIDPFDPTRIRLVAPGNAEYPYAYRTARLVTPKGAPFKGNEVPIHRMSMARIANMPQTDEDLFGLGVSPSALVYPEWAVAMGYLGLLLQDSTNAAAHTLLWAKGITESQVQEAMEKRAERLAEGGQHALSAALMLFPADDGDLIGDGSSATMIGGMALRRYPDGWDWRNWLEERIQIYATLLGISPMSIIMSIYARANQAGAQYAADESGARRASMMTSISDTFSKLCAYHGATFGYKSQRLADQDREWVVRKTAIDAYKVLAETNINGIPLLADTAEEATSRARIMMAEQRLIKNEWAEGESHVMWDTEGEASLIGAKNMAYIGAALRGENYVVIDVDPSESGVSARKTVLGRCVIRDPGRPVMWRGWSARDQIKMAPVLRTVAKAKAASKARNGAMVALYPSPEDAQAMALEIDGAISWKELHITIAYIADRTDLPVSRQQIQHLVDVFASKTPIQKVTISGIGRFGAVNSKGTQPLYASVDSGSIHDLNKKMEGALEAVGIEPSNDHGFQPHITLAYVPADEQTPDVPLEPREITLTRVGLAWGGDPTLYDLQPAVETKEGEGRAPRDAPRRMRQIQDAWEDQLEALLAEMKASLEKVDGKLSLLQKEQLQGLIDRWADNIDALKEATPANVNISYTKLEDAEALVERAQAALDDGSDQRLLLALLALLLFADSVQRRGEDALRQAIKENEALLDSELRRHGAYVNGSLAPDVVGEWIEKGAVSGRLERRMSIWYGGAVWSAMQLALLGDSAPGATVMIAGPLDRNTCRASDPGPGIACETLVGNTYVVGRDMIPVLGRDTKCGQACRHWYEEM